MAATQSFIPPVSTQAPFNVFTTSMPTSDPVGQAGSVVPPNQQIQHPAMSVQLTDITTHATPPQTQPVMISQHSIVPQQQIGMDVQTSTVQQQPQQQMEAQVTLTEHIRAIQLPLGQDQQSLSASAIQKRQQEPEQQTFVQQPVQHVQSASQQHVMATQTAVAVPQQPAEQPHVFQQQLYVKQQFDQQQQTALRQHEQQAQLQHKQLMDKQLQSPVKQEQSAHAYLIEHQQQQHFPLQQQQQSQSYQQTGLHQSRTKMMAEMQQQSEEQQQNNVPVLPLQSQQTQQKNEQLQQQNATQRTVQQVLIQDLQKEFVLKLQQVQQKAQLQQQEQQQVQLRQHLEQQHQVLLQLQLEQQHQQVLLQQQQADLMQQQAQLKHQEQQQQAVNTQPPQTEKHEPAHVLQSNSEVQIQQQTSNLQQLCIPQLNACQFTQQQQSVVAQQHHTSMIKPPRLSVDVPGGTETVQHQTHVIAPTQVPVTIQTSQIPCQTSPVVLTQQGQVHPQKQEQFLVQFLAQSISQAPQPSTEADATSPAAMIPRQMQQMQVYQTQQVPLQANCPGPVTPTQGQAAVQPLIQTQPLHTPILQSHQIPGQVPTVDIQMIGQQNQNTTQPLAAVASVFSPIHDETCVLQNIQRPSLIQSHLQQEAQGQSPYPPQPTAGFLTPQYVPQPSHQSMPSLLHDMARISQQQVHHQQTPQYQPIILSPGLTGNVETKTGGLAVETIDLLATPHPVQIGQGEALSQILHPVVQAQQQSTRSSVDSSSIQPLSQSLMSQSIEQYQQQLQNLSQVQQASAQPNTQPQLLAKPIQIPIPQQSVRQDLTPINECQAPPRCPPTSHMVIQPSELKGASNVAEAQSQSSTLPFYSHLMAAGPPSPQHQAKQMLAAHTHTQTSNQTQTHSQTQTQVHSQAHSQTQTHKETAVPVQQVPLSSSNTSCSSAPPPSLPFHHPTPAPATEFPTSPPVAQVALKRQADFIPSSPSPFVTALQPLGSNVLNLPQALLQDCDISLQGVNQVHGIQNVFCSTNFYSDLLVS